jgi:lysophospholipase L1-like esterase
VRRATRVRQLLVIVAILGSASCGNSPNGPTPLALTLTCPANVSAQSADGNPTSVSFDQPSSSGGTAPITTTCSAQSGSAFPVGASTVNCQAQDSRAQSASCSFVVNVQGPPRLTAARFLAFGDSLTAGVISPAPSLLIVSPPTSYPFLLQDRLAARYRQQTPIVLNEGNPGELASGTGVERFRGVLLQNRPEVVLLMEGTNDLLLLDTGANAAINALRAMIREAKSQNVRMSLATVPPQRPGGRRDAVAKLIPGFNDRIRSLANAEGLPIVDVYNGMKDDLSLIGIDDLHPTVRGYDVMAGIFFDAVRAVYEARPAGSLR